MTLAGTMRFEECVKISADRKHAMAAARFRSAELAFRINFGNFERIACQVHALPAKSKNLADPHPGQNCDRDDGTAGLAQLDKEHSYLGWRIETSFPLHARRADANAVSPVSIQVTPVDGGLHHRREGCAHASQPFARMSLLPQLPKHG